MSNPKRNIEFVGRVSVSSLKNNEHKTRTSLGYGRREKFDPVWTECIQAIEEGLSVTALVRLCAPRHCHAEPSLILDLYKVSPKKPAPSPAKPSTRCS